MLSLIRRALDANRLTKEVERLERENAQLLKELGGKLLGPSYREVAKDFDASAYQDAIMRQVVDDLAPVLERDALKCLKDMMATMRREQRGRTSMIGSVAIDEAARLYQFEFRVEAMGTSVRAAIY